MCFRIKNSNYLNQATHKRSLKKGCVFQPLESEHWHRCCFNVSISNPSFRMHASASQDNTRYLDAAFLNFGVPKVPGQRSSTYHRITPTKKGMIWGFKITKGNFKMLRDRNVVSENGVCWCFLCVLKRLRFCRVKNTKCFLGLSPMKTLFICTLKAPRGSEKRITLARLYMSEWWYFSWISPEINRKKRWTSCSCSIFCLSWWWGLGRNHCNGMDRCSMIGWWKVWGKS